MADCTTKTMEFSSLSRKKVQADFNDGKLTSDGGALLLREVDLQLELIDAIDNCIDDPRNQRYIQHTQRSMLAQRIILDFDATDTPLHGQQEDRFFHGYYDC